MKPVSARLDRASKAALGEAAAATVIAAADITPGDGEDKGVALAAPALPNAKQVIKRPSTDRQWSRRAIGEAVWKAVMEMRSVEGSKIPPARGRVTSNTCSVLNTSAPIACSVKARFNSIWGASVRTPSALA